MGRRKWWLYSSRLCSINKTGIWKGVILAIIVCIATSTYYNHKIVLLTEIIQKLKHEKDVSRTRVIRRIPEFISVLDIKKNASAYAYSSPRNSMCFFRDKLSRENMPTIHSIFSDHVAESVVMVGVKFQKDTWHEDIFNCKFDNGDVSVSDPIVNDFKSFGFLPQYVVVITCPLPEQYNHKSGFTMSLERTVPFPIEHKYSYDNFTVCSAGAFPPKSNFLAVCTMVKDVDDFIPSWIEYHHFMGVEHFYIYDNQIEIDSTLKDTVGMYIKKGIVTIIPWAHKHSHSKTYLEVQIAHENDCVWRHKHDTKWMINIDVDEYIQPMDPSRPKIPDYLVDKSFEKLGSIRVQNWFFGRPTNVTAKGTIIERNTWRPSKPSELNAGHDKNILQLINVHYFKIHAIKLGGETRSVDPWTDLRLVHYRQDNPRQRHFKLPSVNVKDESMVNIWKEIQRKKQKL